MPQSGGILYQEKNTSITIKSIRENLSKDVIINIFSITEVKSVGANMLMFSFADQNNKLFSNTVQFNAGEYRIIERASDGVQIIKSGKNLSTGTETLYLSRCDEGSPVFQMFVNNIAGKQTISEKPVKYGDSVIYPDGNKCSVSFVDVNKNRYACSCFDYTKRDANGFAKGCMSLDEWRVTRDEEEKRSSQIKSRLDYSCSGGAPKIYLSIVEDISTKIQVHPNSITPQKTQRISDERCIGSFYTPRGVLTCFLWFDKDNVAFRAECQPPVGGNFQSCQGTCDARTHGY